MPDQSLRLDTKIEHWPLLEPFRISRGVKSEAITILATVSDGKTSGHGECVPYARYGETVESVEQSILAMNGHINAGPDARSSLLKKLKAGAARNAIDCALWDYEAKRSSRRAAELAIGRQLEAVPTAFTISLADPETMARNAAKHADKPLLKLKLGGPDDQDRIRAVRAAVPETRLIADANEAWTPETTSDLLRIAAKAKLELIEQPLPPDNDQILAELDHIVPVCADESIHQSSDLAALRNRYDAVNIKLDKTGGLTEGLKTLQQAKKLEFKTMIGCMVATSLAMAPALILAQIADWVDLDGPLLLAKDRTPPLTIEDCYIAPPPSELWG